MLATNAQPVSPPVDVLAAATEVGIKKAPPRNGDASSESKLDSLRIPKCDAAPDENVASGDFIELYADYMDNVELPRKAHEAVAITFLASVLNKNGNTIENEDVTYTFDWWSLLLSDSGGGRGTLVGKGLEILDDAGIDVENKSVWGSKQALYQSYAIRPGGLSVWGEFSELMKIINDKSFVEGKTWITDRYDNRAIPKTVVYRETGKADETKPIVFVSSPRLNFLATSSEDWLFRNISTSDSEGGFLPRWCIERCGESRVVPSPKKRDPARAKRLAELLKRIDGIRNTVANISAVYEDYDAWYRAAHGRFKAQSSIASPFWKRHRGHVLKLAVIYEVSRSQTAQISSWSWDKAKSKAREMEEVLFELFRTGMNQHGAVEAQILNFISEAKESGRPKMALTRHFRSLRAPEMNEHLLSLIAREEVLLFVRHKEPGKTGAAQKMLVSKEHEVAYRKSFPRDTQSANPQRELQ